MFIIIIIDFEGFSNKFYVTIFFNKMLKELLLIDVSGVSFEFIKVFIKEKSSFLEELQRIDSNREVLIVVI